MLLIIIILMHIVGINLQIFPNGTEIKGIGQEHTLIEKIGLPMGVRGDSQLISTVMIKINR
jgi:hypothetical protein